MDILFLTNYYPPLHLGGYEELCADVADGLRELGHTVNILTSNVGMIGEDQQGVFRLLHPEVPAAGHGPTVNFFIGREQRLQDNLRTIENTLIKTTPDVILVWGMWNLHRQIAEYLESRTYPPVAYYIADYWPTLPDAYTLHWRAPAKQGLTSVPKWLVARVALFMLRTQRLPKLKFRHAMCVSKAVRQSLIEQGFPLERAMVIYNGINPTQFQPVQKRAAFDPASLLYAGRLTADKGIETAFQALSLMVHPTQNTRLSFVGGGSESYLTRLSEMAWNLGITDRVKFLGKVTRDEMPDVLSQYSVLLVPSTWPEPLPRIVQEGMASGMVVVSSTAGGLKEIVQHDMNGLTFEAGNATELAAQLTRLYGEKALPQRLTSAALATVHDTFNIQRTVDQISGYLHAVVEAQ